MLFRSVVAGSPHAEWQPAALGIDFLGSARLLSTGTVPLCVDRMEIVDPANPQGGAGGFSIQSTTPLETFTPDSPLVSVGLEVQVACTQCSGTRHLVAHTNAGPIALPLTHTPPTEAPPPPVSVEGGP